MTGDHVAGGYISGDLLVEQTKPINPLVAQSVAYSPPPYFQATPTNGSSQYIYSFTSFTGSVNRHTPDITYNEEEISV